MTELLLVYGSLMPELLDAPFGRPQRQRLAAESTVIGGATVAGTLYDLGEHPAMLTPPAEQGDAIHGTLLRLFDPARTFAWLDEFEDVDPSGVETESGYIREQMTVARDGQAQEAWVYIMRRVPPGSHRIPTGKWHAPSPKLGV